MIVPNIKQEPIIVKNNWVNGITNAKYRPECQTIPFYIDYVSDGCVEGWDDTDHELFMHDLDDMVKNNHTYKGYKKNKKQVIFPWRERAYVGYLVKEEKDISECVDDEFNIMFRVPTNLLIDLEEYIAQPVVEYFTTGHYYASGERFFPCSDHDLSKGRIINFYKEKNEMVYIVLSHSNGYFSKLKKEDFISLEACRKINSYYRYGEETDKVKKFG